MIFKQISDFKKDGGKYTKQDHRYYVNYIATRDGAIYGEGKEHGLFGKYGDINGDVSDLNDACNYVGEMFAQGKDVYRCVISLTEEEATTLGYLERDNWVKLLNSKMFDITEEYNIKYENAEYVGSVHLEQGHPHLQFNFWDKNQTIRNKVVPKPQFEKRTENIRAMLSKELYNESLHEILNSRENAGKSILTGFNAFIRGISQQEISAAGLSLKAILPELCDEKMLDIKVDDSYINKIYEGITGVKQAVQTGYPKGALKYKYLPKQCKEALDDLTAIALEHPDFRRELNRYLRYVKEYSVAHGNSSKTIANEQQKAMKELYKSLGNRILSNLREAIREKGGFINSNSPALRGNNCADGVDIIVDQAVRVATIFDNQILALCNDNGVFHWEDIEDNTRLQWRIAKLANMGYIINTGMRYEVLPELKSQVEELTEDFKRNKLWGIDKYFTELRSFTAEDLKAHPKNENGKMEKRLPLLLAAGLVKAEEGAYIVTDEYRQLYKAQLEGFKQTQFDKWFYENIDNDVKISIFDNEFLRMASDGAFTDEDMEGTERYSKLSFRLRRLVAEDYIIKDNGSYIITEKFTKELNLRLEEFKSKLYSTDKAFVKMKRFSAEDIKKNTANKKKNKEDEMGAMEKRLPALLAAGFVLKTGDEYAITDEYHNAYYASSAEYRQKNFDKRTKPGKGAVSPEASADEPAEPTKLNLFDSEFLKLASDKKFTQADIEAHSEGNRLDWRLRVLIKDEYVTAEGINYTLTDKFMRKLSFTQRQFEKGFKVSYKDCAFFKLAQDGVIPKERLDEQHNAAYLKWRIYGLQYKKLVDYDGTSYRLTPELCEKAEAAREKYFKAFSARLFDKAFTGLGESFSLEDVSECPAGDVLAERIAALCYNGLIVKYEDESYCVTPKLTAALKECEESFEIASADASLLKLANESRKILYSDIEKIFRRDEIFMRLEEFAIKEYASKAHNGYVLSEEAVEQIKKAAKEQAGDFAIRYFDRNFSLMGESFTDNDVEQHPEGVFLANRLGTLINQKYIIKSSGLYKASTSLTDAAEKLAVKAEASPFDMNILRLADENNVIDESTITEQEKPIRTEYRLQDLICKGYAAHAGNEYLLEQGFVKNVTAAYEEMAENFVVHPFDKRFESLGKGGRFNDKDVEASGDFFQKRLSSLLLLEYIEKENDSYIVTDALREKTAGASEKFTVNHFDLELVNCADKHGNLAETAVLGNVNADYLEKRMYSLIELGYITKQGDSLHLSPLLINLARNAANSYLSGFKVNCYDAEFLKLGANRSFTKEELKEHEDFGYLNSRLRSLLQVGLMRFDGEKFQLSPQLQLATEAAIKNLRIKSVDNAFLQINGSNTFTQKEADEHFELSTRLRELCVTGWVVKTGSHYTLSEKIVKQVEAELKIFAETKIGIWDKPFIELQREMRGGFTKEDIKARFPDKHEALANRLEYLYVNNLFDKLGDKFFVRQALLDGVDRAEKVQQGIRRQTAVFLLMDVFRMFSKLTNRQGNKQEQEQEQTHKELSLEAKKDLLANCADSIGMQSEDYER